MKKLPIDYHLDAYSVEINNCIDYNIAGAASFYCKDFLKLYCAYWSLYFNWIPMENRDIYILRNEILNILGLEIITEKKITAENIIYKIESIIEKNQPILMNVSTSTLFYALKYMDLDVNYINHTIIINGFDEKRKLLFICENSINKELLNFLTPIQPFSFYQITYDIFLTIFKKNNDLFINDYADKCLYYIKKNLTVDLYQIKLDLFERILYYLRQKSDNLKFEIEDIINQNNYKNKFSDEQFYRTYYHSLKAIFDWIASELKISNNVKYNAMINNYLKLRQQIMNFLHKNNLINSKVNSKKLLEYCEKINNNNDQLYILLNELYNNSEKLPKHSDNLLLNENVKIWADSEKKSPNGYIFKVSNLTKRNSALDVDDFVWISSNKTKQHWVIIDLAELKCITQIKIMHSLYTAAITRNFKICISSDCASWKTIKHIKNNDRVITHLDFDSSLCFQYLKIIIVEPNNGKSFTAIIRNIELLE